jgi:hypothetical protein
MNDGVQNFKYSSDLIFSLNNHNKTSVKHYFWVFIITLASIRGAFVYHLGLPPNEFYIATGMMLIAFGLLSLCTMLRKCSYSELALLKSAIKVNVLFLGFYTVIYMALRDVTFYSIAYQFLVFPIIFVLIRYDEKLSRLIINLISMVTIFGVIYFYNIGITGGFDVMEAAILTLRPGELDYSRIGEHLLPAGYQANHHDAANILVMCSLYFLSQAMILQSRLRVLFNVFIYFICLSLLILTGSSANIIIAIIISVLAIYIYAKSHPWIMILWVCLFALVIAQYIDDLSYYLYFYDHATYNQADLEGNGMFNSLDLSSLFLSLPSILIGFGYILEVPMMTSEVAFIKQLIGFGFVPFIVFSFILFSPYYYLYKFASKTRSQVKFLKMHRSRTDSSVYSCLCHEARYRLIMTAMPCLAGALTLLHYGSLLRVTSVGLFCVFLALFYKKYIDFSRVAMDRFNNSYKFGL